MGPVEVITSVQRRRRWSAGEKRTIVREAEQPGMSISSVARKYVWDPSEPVVPVAPAGSGSVSGGELSGRRAPGL